MSASIAESGAYEYRLNGERTEIREQWQRRSQGNGVWLVTSSRQVPGLELAVEARVASGLVTDCEVTWRGQGQPGISASYSMQVDHIRFTRSVGGRATEQREIAIAPASHAPLLSPLMRIFVGPVIARLLERGGEGPVLVPDIRDPQAQENLLLPLVSERQATLVDANASLLLDGQQVVCRLCEYHGDQYGPGTQFWLGTDDVLLRYQWQQAQQHWDVSLQREDGVNGE